MRSPLPFVVALALAGCSAGDPATSRLKLGDEVIVRCPEPDPKRPPIPTYVDGAGETVAVDIVHDDAVGMKPQGTITTNILAGSKARVIADEAPPNVRPAEPDYRADLDGRVDRRWVKVTVLDGRNANKIGELPRNSLRPAR